MTHEFPDELLSAFLDDELSSAERAMVERHLATSEADRQLLAELRLLRSDVKALPPVAVKADFANRVVRAAMAKARGRNPATTMVSPALPAAKRSSRRWAIGAAVASVSTLAACILLVMQPWQSGLLQPGPAAGVQTAIVSPELAIHGQLFKSLREAMPDDGETVVLRLRISKDVPLGEALDSALDKAGIAALAPSSATEAARLAGTYRRALEAKFRDMEVGTDNKALIGATAAATQAVFVEAPLAQLEGALAELAANSEEPFQLETECKLAFTNPKASDRAEGESGSAIQVANHPPARQSFAQRLNAEHFHLEKKLTPAANAAVNQPSVATVDPQQRVRVLILVEVK